MKKGFTVWLTGLPSAGKSTVAQLLAREFLARGRNVEVLDGEEVRMNLSKGLGFSKEDRDIHIERIGYVAKLLSRNGVAVIVAAISPYRETRERVRKSIDSFVEVYVKCPIEVCMRRDVKGLYARALKGEIPLFTGVSAPYEEPLSPEVICSTEQDTPRQSAAKVIAALETLGLIERDERPDYTAAEEEQVRRRLEDLGYL